MPCLSFLNPLPNLEEMTLSVRCFTFDDFLGIYLRCPKLSVLTLTEYPDFWEGQKSYLEGVKTKVDEKVHRLKIAVTNTSNLKIKTLLRKLRETIILFCARFHGSEYKIEVQINQDLTYHIQLGESAHRNGGISVPLNWSLFLSQISCLQETSLQEGHPKECFSLVDVKESFQVLVYGLVNKRLAFGFSFRIDSVSLFLTRLRILNF
jgi:hypothetical protein